MRSRAVQPLARPYIMASTLIALMAIIGSPRSQAVFVGLWIAPIVLAMIHDFVKRRLIHPVYLIGIAALGLSAYRDAIRSTELRDVFTVWLAAVLV